MRPDFSFLSEKVCCIFLVWCVACLSAAAPPACWNAIKSMLEEGTGWLGVCAETRFFQDMVTECSHTLFSTRDFGSFGCHTSRTKPGRFSSCTSPPPTLLSSSALLRNQHTASSDAYVSTFAVASKGCYGVGNNVQRARAHPTNILYHTQHLWAPSRHA